MLKTQHAQCTGCTACCTACPVGTISMVEDAEGFEYPVVEHSACIYCDVCNIVCPVGIYKENKKLMEGIPKVYATCVADERIVQASSSGGIFTAVARYCFSQDGVVYGAGYDECGNVYHTSAKNEAELSSLRKSKYVQSSLGDIFRHIKQVLAENRYVLFTGTPCQVDGLLYYLGKKYEKLLTLDFICHGVPSPKVYREYIAELVSEQGTLLNVEFRSKKTHTWNELGLVIEWKVANKIQRYSATKDTDIYMQGFLNNLYLRPCCGDCAYTNIARISDVTIADFWNISSFDPTIEDDKGISLVLVNSEAGKDVFNAIQPELALSKKMSIEIAKESNSSLEKSFAHHSQRKIFFNSLHNGKAISTNIAKALDCEKKVACLNLFTSANFGAICMAFSIEWLVAKCGYTPVTINFHKYDNQEYWNSRFERFANTYLTLTAPVRTYDEIKEVTKGYPTIVVGSDQVWRYKYTADALAVYHLGFVPITTKKIAYGASFGVKTYETKERGVIDLVKYYMGRMDAISVREDSGVEICSSIFDVQASHVLDPVFVLPIEQWENLIQKSTLSFNEDTSMCYILDNTESIEKKVLALIDALNTDVYDNKNVPEVEDWIASFKYAKYIITDSFHGMCFSIIFKKQFLCFVNKERGAERFFSLVQQLGGGLSSHIITDIEEFTVLDMEELMYKKIDYQEIETKIEHLKEHSIHYMNNALNQVGTYGNKQSLYSVRWYYCKVYIIYIYIYILYVVKVKKNSK